MKKKFLSLGTAFLIAIGVGLNPMVVSANTNNPELLVEDYSPRAEGLISVYSLHIKASNGNLLITATTRSNSIMSSIGFKNISVQRSSGGSTWTEELTVADQLAHNSTSNSLSSYIVPVAGNYNYRVQLNHFADNGSGSTQSVPNTSNVIWIS